MRSLITVSLSILAILALVTSVGDFQALGTTSAAGASGFAAQSALNQPGSAPLDQAGVTWVRTFGGNAIDIFVNIVQTIDGGYAMAGATGSFGAGGGDGWVVRLDASGNPVWQKTYGGGRFDAAESILATSDGGFLVTGTTLSFGVMDDEALAFKLDASGNVQWQRTFGGNFAENFFASAQAADGGFVLVGTTNSFGAGAPGAQDMWVVRINASGDIVWQKTYGGSGTERGEGVVATSDGGFVVVGATRLTGNEAIQKGWALKLNGDGSVAWQKAYAGNGGDSNLFSVVATGDGGATVVGSTRAPGRPLPPSAGWAIKLGPEGDIQWQKTFSSPDNKDASLEWIRQTSSGGYVLAGATLSSFETRTDGWILNLDPEGNLIWGRSYGGGDQRSLFSGVIPTSDDGFAAVGSTRAFGAGQEDAWMVKTDANGDVAGCTVGSPLMPTVADSTGSAADTNITPADSTAAAMPSNPTVQDSVGQNMISGVCGPPPVVTPPVPPPPGPPPPPAPSDVCPPTAPFFPETGFCIDNPQIQAYFQDRGGVDTFGFPVSRSFVLLGFPAQVFQRHILRVHPDGVRPVNLLDPDVLPVTTVNFATFPPNDPVLAGSAPPPTTPNYGQAVLAHLQANVPDTLEGVNVQFLQSYLAAGQQAAQQGDFAPLVALEIWGFPTSNPARDPNNANFIYQRFQRAILHSFPDPTNPANRVTRGILLADNLKFVLTNDPVLLPADLRAQVQASPFFNQYCPTNPAWVCRPAELPGTDMTSAFEKQRQ